jgi:hypothetical protein
VLETADVAMAPSISSEDSLHMRALVPVLGGSDGTGAWPTSLETMPRTDGAYGSAAYIARTAAAIGLRVTNAPTPTAAK